MKINEDQPMGRTKPVYSELAIQHGANSYPLPFGREGRQRSRSFTVGGSRGFECALTGCYWPKEAGGRLTRSRTSDVIG